MKQADLQWTVEKHGSHPKASAEHYVSMPSRKKYHFFHKNKDRVHTYD